MNEIQWVPGFIQLSRKAGGTVSLRIDAVLIYEGMNRTGGTTIRVREFPDWIQVEETPEQIGELIRQAWEGGVSLQAEIRRAVESGETE